MTRISLKEAYDNKDVVTQICGLKDEVAKHDEILNNLPDPDLTNCVLKTGDQTIDGKKTFNDEATFKDVIHADGGLDLANMGPLTVNGNLEVNGDIIQNGSAYETHAEQVFSANDYIVTRDGAVSSLPAGGYSGIQVKKYNGVDDCRLVVDNTGTARVGDINDEQPLMTRDEAGSMSNGALLKWDGVNGKAVSSPMDNTPTADSVNAVTSDGIKTALDAKVSGTGTIGTNLKPIKIVNGVAVAIDNDLVSTTGNQEINGEKTLKNNLYMEASVVRKGSVDTSTPASGYQNFGDLVIWRDSVSRGLMSLRRDRDTTWERGFISISKYVDALRTDTASLDLRIESNGTVNVIVRKTINGVTTSHTIATL